MIEILDLNDGLWIHFLNNHQTSYHCSIVYDIRELHQSEENKKFSSNKTLHHSLLSTMDQAFDFASDYEVRIYQSGCFYLDSNHQWQSDGLIVRVFRVRCLCF
jgi:hypothetical protein